MSLTGWLCRIRTVTNSSLVPYLNVLPKLRVIYVKQTCTTTNIKVVICLEALTKTTKNIRSSGRDSNKRLSNAVYNRYCLSQRGRCALSCSFRWWKCYVEELQLYGWKYLNEKYSIGHSYYDKPFLRRGRLSTKFGVHGDDNMRFSTQNEDWLRTGVMLPVCFVYITWNRNIGFW